MRPDLTLVLFLVAMTALAGLPSPMSGPVTSPEGQLVITVRLDGGTAAPGSSTPCRARGSPCSSPRPWASSAVTPGSTSVSPSRPPARPRRTTRPTRSSTASAARSATGTTSECSRSATRPGHASRSSSGPTTTASPSAIASPATRPERRTVIGADRLPAARGLAGLGDAVRRPERVHAGLRDLLGGRDRRRDAVAHRGRLGVPLALPYPGRPMGTDHRGRRRRFLLRQPAGQRRAGRASTGCGSPTPARATARAPSSRHATLPWATPWRVIIVGTTPAGVVESTLVENLSPPSVVADTSWIKPGRVSWSWLFDPPSPQDFHEAACRSSTSPPRWAGSTRSSTPTGTS